MKVFLLKCLKKFIIFALYSGLFLIFVLLLFSLCFLILLEVLDVKLSQILSQPLDFAPKLTTEIYARDGELLAQFYSEFRYYAKFEEIPTTLINAVIATEDKNFFSHRGVDLSGSLRALWHNVWFGGIKEGGSTITQQLVCSLYLSSEPTLKRKIAEIILALRMELKYTKREILEMYLNQVYFGSGAYGVKAASLTYFTKDLEEINLAESALFAGLITAPSRLSPYVDEKAAKERQLWVLDRMKKSGLITEKEAEEAAGHPLQFEDKSIKAWKAPYFVDFIRDILIEEFGETAVREGGLRVYTSLDPTLQRFAEEAVQEGIEYWKAQEVWPDDLTNQSGIPQPQVALVTLNPKNGDVLAIVGGTDYSQTQYNRTLSLRQPGSAFKIFVYSTAFESGALKPSDILISEPININGWSPSEYRENPFSGARYYGKLTVREALVRSSNIAAVKVAMATGLDKIVETARSLGITTELQPYPSMAIGSEEVIPLEMAQAYGVLANGGIKAELRPILRVENWKGELIKEYSVFQERALSEQTCVQLTDYFQSVIATTMAFIPSLPSAGKTGTTDFFMDAWFCGYTPNISCAVWTGNDDSTVNFTTRYNIGMYLPASFWGKFMEKALTILPKEEFYPGKMEKIAVYVCKDSSARATMNCPKEVVVKEYFLRGTEPQGLCPMHTSTTVATVGEF
jgi:penicillin-binding protein 1A